MVMKGKSMWGRIFILTFSSMAILATSFCAQKNDRSRDVSSGIGASSQDQIVTMPTDLGSWILAKSSVNEPVNTTYMTVSYSCGEDTKQILYYDEPIVMVTGSDRLVKKAYSWGEIKEMAPNTYKKHHGANKPQTLRTVIWIKYWKIPEINLVAGSKSTNTEKMVVLDLATVCQD